MDFDFSGPKSSVFNRLYQLSVTKRQLKASASQPQLSKPKSVGPRNPVELNLVAWHQKTQAKLHHKRVESAARQRLQQPGVPQINSMSQHLASQPTANEPEKKEAAAAHVADTLRSKQRRKTTLSNSLGVTFKDSVNSQSTCDIKVDLSKYSSTLSKDKPSTSTARLQTKSWATPRTTPHGVNYSSFASRLTGKTTQRELKPRSYADLETDIVHRTMYWKNRKEEKLQQKRDDRQAAEIAGCTFRPMLSPSRPQSKRTQSMSQLSQGTSYSRLVTSSTKFSYAYGLNVGSFLKKARPMVDYTAVVTLK